MNTKPFKQTHKPATTYCDVKLISRMDIDNTLLISAQHNKRHQITLHDSFDELPQRFVNCLHTKSYVRPHMHPGYNHWELFCLLYGEVIVLTFNEQGMITNRFLMNEDNIRIVEIKASCYHTCVATKPSSFLEICNREYNETNPYVNKIWADWAPEEYDDLGIIYRESLLMAQVGDTPTY